MLLEDQPEGPVLPAEVIDHMVRGGYLGGHVDEWFDLSPVYRQEQPAADEFEAPPGIDVPEGMAAVPEEQIIEWPEQLASEANEMAGSRKVPDFIDLCAKIVLPAVCGDDRARTFPAGTNLLGWNLFVFGYWCRAVEMRALATNDASAEVAGQLRTAHESGLGGAEWFGTLQGASYRKVGGVH